MIRYLPELLKENVISQETAENITNYYLKKKKQGLSKLFVIFGVLGALLVGLGVILIIAHNWDDLPKYIKTVLAISPLIVSQFLCGFTLIKKQRDIAWKESSSIFLFLSVGACISLISQIYHVSGDLSDFLLLWMILSFPVIYIMNSSFTSLLYIAGITYFSCESGYWSHANANHYYYWLLITGIVPYFIKLVRNTPLSNFVKFHKILIALSLIISLGTLAKSNKDLFYFSYLNLFAILSMISIEPFQNRKEENNDDEIFEILGFTGTMIILFMLSFDWFWKKYYFHSSKFLEIHSFLPLCITTLIAVLLLYRKYRSSGAIRINPSDYVWLLMLLIYIVAGSSLAIILTNSIILFLGVHTIVKGLKINSLGILNLGMIIMAALIVCRFFDSEITFLARGILFVFVGICFFFSNYWMLRRRRYEN